MVRDNLDLSLVMLSNSAMERKMADRILSCNEESRKYGLVLTEQQVMALLETRTQALQENRRIELNGYVIDKLILAFCDSPYMESDTYEGILHELIDLFYDLKHNTWDRVSDDNLIEFMKHAFNHHCYGSMELLEDEAWRLSEHIHLGKSIETFKED